MMSTAYGQAAIIYAAREGHDDIVIDLLVAGADPNTRELQSGISVLMNAAAEGSSKAANALLNAGARVNDPDNMGDTPLMVASKGGHETVMKFLLGKGAEKDFANLKGRTALMGAAEKNRDKAINLLLELGGRCQYERRGWYNGLNGRGQKW